MRQLLDLARWQCRTYQLSDPTTDDPVVVVGRFLAVQAENQSQAVWAVATRTTAVRFARDGRSGPVDQERIDRCGWIGDRPWGSSAGESIDVVGSFHLEDPEGQVGMQVHIVASAGLLFQVPLSVLAGVASCGYGQTLGFARVDGRWQAWPESAKVHGYGAVAGRVLVDRFERVATESTDVVVRNEHLELTVFRALADRPLPTIGMTATWPAQPDPVVLASVVAKPHSER